MTAPHDNGAVIRTREFALERDTLYRLLVARTFGGQMRIFMLNGVVIAVLVASVAYATFDLSQAGGLALLVGLLAVIALALGLSLIHI